MTCGKMVRLTVRFPFLQSDSILSGGPIPGPETAGSQVFLSTNPNGWTIPDPNGMTAFQAARQVSIPRTGGLRAISIAPDSPVHSCDISIGGLNGEIGRHRVSPGNPLLGDLDGHDFMHVTLPISIPVMEAANTFDVFTWDATPAAQASVGEYWQLPLRLELWYGDLPPIRSPNRAVYHARARVIVFGPGDVRSMTMLTDGRGRIVADFQAVTATCTARIDQLMPTITGTARRDSFASRTIAGPTLLTAGANRMSVVVPTELDQRITPISMIRVFMTDSVGTGALSHQMDIYAYDD